MEDRKFIEPKFVNVKDIEIGKTYKMYTWWQQYVRDLGNREYPEHDTEPGYEHGICKVCEKEECWAEWEIEVDNNLFKVEEVKILKIEPFYESFRVTIEYDNHEWKIGNKKGNLCIGSGSCNFVFEDDYNIWRERYKDIIHENYADYDIWKEKYNIEE